jgi:hypothetical protein
MTDTQLYMAIGIPLLASLFNTGLLVWVLSELRDIRKDLAHGSKETGERLARLETKEDLIHPIVKP